MPGIEILKFIYKAKGILILEHVDLLHIHGELFHVLTIYLYVRIQDISFQLFCI